jgi:CheY-like chemotaxis protein
LTTLECEPVTFGTALIADNKESIRTSLAEVLERYELRVVQAASGPEAMESASKQHVDVAVLDINMPGDGISTAEGLQREYPGIILIFLTAFDTPANRHRAAQLGVRVEAWIDKDSDWTQSVAFTVLGALKTRREAKLPERIRILGRELGVRGDQLSKLQELLDHELSHMRHVSAHLADISRPHQFASPGLVVPRASKVPTADEALEEASREFYEVEIGYDDVAHRELNWEALKKTLVSRLWPSIERSSTDGARQQLVDQLVAATEGIESHQLTKRHLSALALALERIRTEKVGPRDVDECERMWRLADVDTLPSLSELLTNWQELYGLSEEDDSEKTSS